MQRYNWGGCYHQCEVASAIKQQPHKELQHLCIIAGSALLNDAPCHDEAAWEENQLITVP
jgi:hypothetical protein